MKRTGNLIKNTVMLYILQFSSYFFSFITVPYQTRVLGPEVYGVVGFATAVMVYFQLFLDFGFMLSATEDISKHREDKAYIEKKLTSITVLKCFLTGISAIVMAALCLFVPKFRADPTLYLLYFAAYAANAFLPDFLYRGIEKMTAITGRTVAIRAFFAVMIFVFLRTKEQVLMIPLLLLIGNIGAVAGAFLHIRRALGYRFRRVCRAEVLADLRRSLFFFVSRIATTVYSAANTVILGFVDTTGTATGCYASADKVLTTAKSGMSPIADSLYPYMVKHRDFKLVKKLLLFAMPVIAAGCAVVFIFAKPLCVLAFGEEFAGAAPILQAFVPAVAAILPSYVLGFPTLGAMGRSADANRSVLVGTVVHIVGLGILFAVGKPEAVYFAAMTSVSEWAILICRIVMVAKHKGLLKSPEEEESE